MDNLLVSSKQPRTLISSTKINDLSKKISVGADEMLVNAINHMNIKSGSYVFLDQSFSKDFGQLVLLSPTENQEKPKFYFRGAITQLDNNTINDRVNLDLDFSNAPNPITINGGPIETASQNLSQGTSIVSVDLHLVSYPDKTVLPGGSVANSMVVTNKTFGGGASGLIKLTGFDTTLSFNRVESIGQAVRNLIELGTIELIGRHAKVPYWQCLNIEPTNEKLENKKRFNYFTTPKSNSILKTQKMLSQLGYYKNRPDGKMNLQTHAALAKFQADKNLIASGELNYDVYNRLKQEISGFPVNGRVRSVKPNLQAPLFKPPKPVQTQKGKGKYLTLVSTKTRYKASDPFIGNITSKAAGYLYCFHQSGAGAVTQILPQKSNIRLQTVKNYTRNLPDKLDGFSVRFETGQKLEHLMCVLQNNSTNPSSPFDSRFKKLGPLPVSRLEDIPARFAKFGGVLDWVMISKSAQN